MSTQQTDALQCAADLEYSIARHGMQDAFTLNAYRAMKMVRTQHARITELESQLAQRFDAADMATAAASGFRDGAAKEQQAGWVSVDERLPGEQGQDSEEVMLFINGHCALTDFECRQGGAWGIRLGYFDADRQVFRVHGRPEPHVTHWRQEPPAPPLPDAPGPSPADGESK